MIRLDQIGLREMRLPLREPFHISFGALAERRIALPNLSKPSDISPSARCRERDSVSPAGRFAAAALAAFASVRVFGPSLVRERER